MVEHYWDHFDFTDTSYVHLPDVTEQAFTDFVYMLTNVPDTAIVRRAEVGVLRSAGDDSTMLAYFVSLYEKYLYDPNSPMRSEKLYTPVLDALIASDKTTEADKVRFRYRRTMIDKNRIGGVATDFRYTLASGASAMMHGIRAEYTLLYFNNPGCEECRNTTAHLTSSPLFEGLLSRGMLKILALYPDEDVKQWHEKVTAMPSLWINAYDAGTVIRNKDLYDLRAIPCLYLLDRDKKVLLKDAPIEMVDRYLATHTQPLP